MLKLWRANLESSDTRENIGRSFRFWLAATSQKDAQRRLQEEVDRYNDHTAAFKYVNEQWFPMKLQFLLEDAKKHGFDKLKISSGKRKLPVVVTNWQDAWMGNDGCNITQLIDTMGMVEDEGWVNLQKEAMKQTEQIIRNQERKGGIASYSVIGGITHCISVLADKHADDDARYDNLYTVYGSGGYNRWFFKGDGTVSFSVGHALTEKRTFAARMMGFNMTHMPRMRN